jgi:hypothetical protein
LISFSLPLGFALWNPFRPAVSAGHFSRSKEMFNVHSHPYES